jgi:DNA uptake protein ComE-like DNA-binding protein
MKSHRLLATAGALVIGLSLPLAAMAQQGTTPAKPAQTAPTHAASKGAAKHPAIDLNAASKEELMKAPGIDDATADKIIAARPFKSKNELVSRKIVTESEFKKLQSHVMVKAQHAAATTAK